MALLGRRLAVSIPDTVLEDKESLREKTAKLGLIARACAIYGVDLIEVFRDPKGRGEGKTIREVLEYLETPQYLRKRLYPIDETLKFAGVLPPLRIPSHKPRVPVDGVGPGEVREGVVNDDGSVDVGLDVSPRLGGDAQPGKRVTVRISSMKPPRADVIAKESLREYWGYTVEDNQLDDMLTDPRFRTKIATSRLGMPLPKALGRLRTLLEGGSPAKLIFGSPSRGLFDMVGRDLDQRVDLVLNLFPAQQVETVRTEEALLVGLGVVGLISAEKA
jgi:methyltransferase